MINCLRRQTNKNFPAEVYFELIKKNDYEGVKKMLEKDQLLVYEVDYVNILP